MINITDNLSFWEKQTWFNDIDVTIIGSGIVGLNAALSLKKSAPRLKVLVLERGFLPSGASTKNAGFACFGSPSELLDDLKKSSENKVFSLVEKRWQGLQRLRSNLGDTHIDFQAWGGYELFDQEERYQECAAQLDYLNQNLKSIIGLSPVYQIVDRKIGDFGFKHVRHLIANHAEGQIDTGKMMAALTRRVQEQGVMIVNAIGLTQFANDGNEVTVTTDRNISLRTRKLLIAVNGFARELLPDYEVFPARAQVLITAPLKQLKFKGTFHFDEGYYYFRNIGSRVLFGGGRNLDFNGEQTSQTGLTPLVQEKLEYYLNTMILPGQDYTVETRWSGIMGLGRQDKTFIVKKVRENIFCAVRMGGMGVAVGSLVGEEAAQLILQEVL